MSNLAVPAPAREPIYRSEYEGIARLSRYTEGKDGYVLLFWPLPPVDFKKNVMVPRFFLRFPLVDVP